MLNVFFQDGAGTIKRIVPGLWKFICRMYNTGTDSQQHWKDSFFTETATKISLLWGRTKLESGKHWDLCFNFKIKKVFNIWKSEINTAVNCRCFHFRIILILSLPYGYYFLYILILREEVFVYLYYHSREGSDTK